VSIALAFRPTQIGAKKDFVLCSRATRLAYEEVTPGWLPARCSPSGALSTNAVPGPVLDSVFRGAFFPYRGWPRDRVPLSFPVPAPSRPRPARSHRRPRTALSERGTYRRTRLRCSPRSPGERLFEGRWHCPPCGTVRYALLWHRRNRGCDTP